MADALSLFTSKQPKTGPFRRGVCLADRGVGPGVKILRLADKGVRS